MTNLHDIVDEFPDWAIRLSWKWFDDYQLRYPLVYDPNRRMVGYMQGGPAIGFYGERGWRDLGWMDAVREPYGYDPAVLRVME